MAGNRRQLVVSLPVATGLCVLPESVRGRRIAVEPKAHAVVSLSRFGYYEEARR